jgi:dienelactone hydrolase
LHRVARGDIVPIQFVCPTCGKQYAISEQFAGRSARCKACKAPFTVPAADPPREPEVDHLEEVSSASCPYCSAEIAEGTVLCVRCGRHLQTGQMMRTAVSAADRITPPRQPSALGRLARSPIPYVVVGSLAFILVMMLSPTLSVFAGMGIIGLGILIGIAGYIFYGISMWVACYREYGILPIVALFIPVVSFFVQLWMIIKYWAYAWRALASLGVGILIVLAGSAVAATMGRAGFMSHKAAASVPEFPDLPAPSHPTPWMDLYNIRIGGTGPGTNMRLLLYLPAVPEGAERKEHSLPCVLIAPAGTSMLTGIALGEGDMKEHVDYVRRGFAVAAFDLDGPVSEHASVRELALAVRSFRDARYGLVNAHNAIDYLMQKVPTIDPELLFAAGHSSAGGFALNLAAEDHRIKGVAAYAPSTDILHHQPARLFSALKFYIRDIESFAQEASPLTHAAEIDCPVMIFHADDDDVVPSGEITTFVDSMKVAGKNVQVKTVPTGGHYESMIRQGIGQGIAFLQPLAPGIVTAEPKTSVPARAQPTVEAAGPGAAPAGGPMPGGAAPPSEAIGTAPGRPAPARGMSDARSAAAHYTIPGPSGFEADQQNQSGIMRWRSSGTISASYTVIVRHSPVPEAPRGRSGKTIQAGAITFVDMSGSANSPVLMYAARDGEYYLQIMAVNSRRDPDVTKAITDAISRIRPAADGAASK